MNSNGTQWVYDLVNRISAPLDTIYKDLNRVDNAALKAETDLHSMASTNTGLSTLTGTIGGLVAAAGGFFAISKIADWGHEIFTIGSEMEQINMNYRTMLNGNVAVSDKLVAGLKDFGKNTKFSNMEVLEAGQGLLAFGVKTDQILPKIKTIGDLSLGNSAKFKSMVDNYGKMVSAQRGNTTDINQFAIAGIPIWQGLEKVIGKSGAELRKYVEQNGVSISQIDQVFESLTSKGGTFFEALKNSSNTTIAKLGNVMAGFEELAEKIFGKLQPYINVVLDFGITYLPVLENALKSVYNTFRDGVHWIEENRLWLEAVTVALGFATLGWAALNYQLLVTPIRMALVEAAGWTLYAMTEAITAAQWLWNIAMNANPIGLLITGLSLTAGWMFYAYQKSEVFRGVIWGIVEAVKALSIGLLGVGETVVGVFLQDMDMIQKGIKDIEIGMNPGKAYEKGKQKSAEADAKKEAKTQVVASVVPGGESTGAGAGAGVNTAAGANSSSSSSSGGSGTGRNINVTIQKLGEVVIHATGMDDIRKHMPEIQSMVHEYMIAGVRDFEQSISNT